MFFLALFGLHLFCVTISPRLSQENTSCQVQHSKKKKVEDKKHKHKTPTNSPKTLRSDFQGKMLLGGVGVGVGVGVGIGVGVGVGVGIGVGVGVGVGVDVGVDVGVGVGVGVDVGVGVGFTNAAWSHSLRLFTISLCVVPLE